jgi:protein-tyrosine phosphatase
VQPPNSFADIHCHLLPDVDDGAVSWDESLAMARLAVADGTSVVVATPHQLGSYAENTGEKIRKLSARLQQLLDEQGVALRVLPGADVRIEPDMIRKIRSGEVVTLADRGRYVLLELPHELYIPLERLIGNFKAAGLVAILSHPERNRGILARPDVLEPLVDSGCLLQVTAGSLVGSFGPQVRCFAERLVSEGFVHFVATDAHGAQSRRPLMGRAFQRVAQIAGERAADELCCTNPARVVADQLVPRARRRSPSGGLTGWFRRGKAG